GNPLQSRPSLPLLASVLVVVALGVLLPFTSLAGVLGFTPLPGSYLIFLVGVTSTYLLLVEWIKRRLLRRLLGCRGESPSPLGGEGRQHTVSYRDRGLLVRGSGARRFGRLRERRLHHEDRTGRRSQYLLGHAAH